MESLATVLDLLGRPEFLTGLGLGIVGVALFIASGADDIGGWALAVAGASLAGIFLTVDEHYRLALGLAVLATGGWLVGRYAIQPAPNRSRLEQSASWGVVLLGSLVVTAVVGIRLDPLVRLLNPFAVVVLGYLLTWWRSGPHRELLGPLFAISAFGMWITVPETDAARVLLGVSLPLAALTLPWKRIGVTTPGAFALGGLVVWAAAFGGEPREASIIGSWGSIGLIAIFPILGQRVESVRKWVIVVTHSAFVLIATRVIGLRVEAAPALLALLLLGLATYAVLALSLGRARQSQGPR